MFKKDNIYCFIYIEKIPAYASAVEKLNMSQKPEENSLDEIDSNFKVMMNDNNVYVNDEICDGEDKNLSNQSV